MDWALRFRKGVSSRVQLLILLAAILSIATAQHFGII